MSIFHYSLFDGLLFHLIAQSPWWHIQFACFSQPKMIIKLQNREQQKIYFLIINFLIDQLIISTQ